MIVVLVGGTVVIGATFCGSSNHSSCTDCGGGTPKAMNNSSSGGGTASSGSTASDPSKPDTGMAMTTPPKTSTPPKTPEPTTTKDASSAPASDDCPATAPKLLDPCDDTSGRGCTYGDKSGTCNNLYYCFEGVWAAAKQTMSCGAGTPDVCPSSISSGAVCKPGSASDVESWMTAGAYPCVLKTGSVCSCDADLPCGAMAPPPGAGAPASGKWNCTPASPCPVRAPAQGAACAKEGESCSYRRFCDVTTATCSGGHWALTMTQAAP
jgi:hypothetical protein